MSGSRSRRCSSVPNSLIGKQARVCTLTPRATLAQRAASSSTHLQVDLVGLPAAADVLTEGQAQQAGVAEQAEDLAREALLALVLPGLGGEFGVGQLAGQRDEVPGLLGGQFTVDQHGSPRDGGAATVPAIVSASRSAPTVP